MSNLIEAMRCLRCIFEKYSGKEGDPNTLTKKELSDLLRHELHVNKSTAEVDNFFSMLDNDSDGLVSFQEYATFVAALSTICCEQK